MISRDELIPVDKSDGFFVASDAWIAADIPFPPASDRSRLLRRGYKSRRATVLIEGRSCAAAVLEAPDGHDQSFAQLLGDDDGSYPNDPQNSIPEVTHSEREGLLFGLYSRFGESEGVLPEQRSQILGGFVEPRLVLRKGVRTPISWVELRDCNHLLVSGAPGSGKTTLLRHWILWHAERARTRESDLLPLCLPLRHLRRDENIETALSREASNTDAPWLSESLSVHAQRGKLAIAFDGLDEVPSEDRERAIDGIRVFTSRFPDCRYLVTTRPEVVLNLDLGVFCADILPFDKRRFRQLAYYKLYETGCWKSFVTKVEAEPALEWVAGNPLAVSMVMARFLRHEITPSYVGEIINAVIEMFIDTWDASRGIVRTRRWSMSPGEKRKILAALAVANSERQSSESREDDDLEIGMQTKEDFDEVFSILAEHTGLLSRQDRSSWSFQSPAVQDFLRAAVWVSALASKAEEFKRLISTSVSATGTHLIRFIASMSSDADKTVLSVLGEMHANDFAVAARLTSVLSEGGPKSKRALQAYANKIAHVFELLAPNFVLAYDYGEGSVVTLTVSTGELTVPSKAGLSALVRALHRSRDGVATKSFVKLIDSQVFQHLAPVRALLESDGELSETQTEESMTWQVREIMPAVPSGPDSQDGH